MLFADNISLCVRGFPDTHAGTPAPGFACEIFISCFFKYFPCIVRPNPPGCFLLINISYISLFSCAPTFRKTEIYFQLFELQTNPGPNLRQTLALNLRAISFPPAAQWTRISTCVTTSVTAASSATRCADSNRVRLRSLRFCLISRMVYFRNSPVDECIPWSPNNFAHTHQHHVLTRNRVFLRPTIQCRWRCIRPRQHQREFPAFCQNVRIIFSPSSTKADAHNLFGDRHNYELWICGACNVHTYHRKRYLSSPKFFKLEIPKQL